MKRMLKEAIRMNQLVLRNRIVIRRELETVEKRITERRMII